VTARALLAEHRGDHADGERLFADSAKRWEGFEMPWERAQALLGQGRCLLALGRTSKAISVVHLGREIFVSLSTNPSVTKTDGLLERAIAISS